MRPSVRRVGNRPPTRRDPATDTAFIPMTTTRPHPRRVGHGQDWNVAHPRAEHLLSAGDWEIGDLVNGFSTGIDTSARAMRAVVAPVMYGPEDEAATAFLAAHGFNRDGVPFKRDRPS